MTIETKKICGCYWVRIQQGDATVSIIDKNRVVAFKTALSTIHQVMT